MPRLVDAHTLRSRPSARKDLRLPASSLDSMSEREILETRLCDLDLHLEGSPLSACVAALHAELQEAGFPHFQPKVYIGDEWFSPDGVPAISVPFWLLHPRLRRLERRIMSQVEGGTRDWCMRLLRHEAGHCFDHAYQVSIKKKWRQLFGDPALPYDTESYLSDPKSRSFVVNLEDHYAQSHPDEDFAETFAVILNPACHWRRIYARWPRALAKLNYVEDLVQRHGPRKPRIDGGPMIYKASRIRRTIGRCYDDRLKEKGLPAYSIGRFVHDHVDV